MFSDSSTKYQVVASKIMFIFLLNSSSFWASARTLNSFGHVCVSHCPQAYYLVTDRQIMTFNILSQCYSDPYALKL